MSCTVHDYPSGNSRTKCGYAIFTIANPRTHRSLLKGTQKYKIWTQFLNLLGSNWRAWGVVLPDTCGIGFGPPDCPHRSTEGRGENLSFMAKIQNVGFIYVFELFIEIKFLKWVFSYSS